MRPTRKRYVNYIAFFMISADFKFHQSLQKLFKVKAVFHSEKKKKEGEETIMGLPVW